jgi:hypothetical protein
MPVAGDVMKFTAFFDFVCAFKLHSLYILPCTHKLRLKVLPMLSLHFSMPCSFIAEATRRRQSSVVKKQILSAPASQITHLDCQMIFCTTQQDDLIFNIIFSPL